MIGMIIWILWAILLFVVASIWASRHLEINQAKRMQLAISSNSYDSSSSYEGLTKDGLTKDGATTGAPFVSVLIAGKDEEANIERAVRSMLRQDYPNFELIVVNDRSTDKTPEILERLQAEDATGRLKVVHVAELREGWFGKSNAMRVGLESARGDWFCFGDADCNQTSERSLSIAVRHALEKKADFLSVLPRLETESLWERIVQPVAGAVMVLWFDPRKVNDPNTTNAYANGAFILMTRQCYEAIGGFEAVKTEINEDMHMARLAKERRQRLIVCQNNDLYTVRMYSNFSQIWQGWSRIFYGCFGTFRRLRLSMMMLIVMNVFPYSSLLLAGAVMVATGGEPASVGWNWILLASASAVGMQLSLIARFYKLSDANPWLAPTFIVGAVICIGILGSAMMKLNGRRAVTWRGTSYRGQQVASASVLNESN